jgi:diguanylate cyclase (GGDEF)-like protein/PAS domain S-box-containing protein
MVVVLALIDWIFEVRIMEISEEQNKVIACARDVSELLVLTNEFAEYSEERAVLQWKVHHKNIVNALTNSIDSKTRLLTKESLTQAESSAVIFDRLVALSHSPNNKLKFRSRQLILDQLLTNEMILSDSVNHWGELTAISHNKAEQQFHAIALVIPVLLIIMLLFITAILVQRILLPIAQIQAAVAAVAKGDLSARSNTNTNDELGELSRSFDAMALDMVAELRREISERKQAQDQIISSEKRFRNFFDKNSSTMLLIEPKTGEIIDANEAAASYYGYDRTKLVEMKIGNINILPPILIAEAMEKALKEKRKYFVFSHRISSGEIRDVEVHSTPIESSGRELLFTIVHDITDRKRAEANIQITASVFNSSQEAIIISDADNAIIDVNPAFTKITGYSRDEVIGKDPNILSSGLQNEEFYVALWKSILEENSWRGEIWNKRKNGEIFPEQISISTICDDNGKILRYIAVFSDISHIKQYEAELRRVAHYDALTGIPNRILLADRMKQAIAQTSREQNMMAVCYLDLDGFKPINDSSGHETGDEVLVEIAKRIGNTIRGGDTVARLGGDEFVVLLLGLEKGEECVTTLERLLTSIAEPISVKNKTFSVSASIGLSMYPMDDEDPDTLLRHADQAMYSAKQSGKNRFHIYDVALDRRARNQNEFLKSIRYALDHNQFELYYQPKVNLRTKELVGAEALIRWWHPERGLLSPSEFLRLIENTDLDIEIGEWVTATALNQIDQWRKAGLDIEVSINISGYHLESAGFIEKLKQQCTQNHNLPFGKLQIEVLETAALNDIPVVSGIIESCRKFGVRFALDDFGTGYSSLSYLSGLPVDALKIDQSFVRDMLEDEGDRAIVIGIVALAKAFHRQAVAEGIETEAQFRMLLDMGCEVGQGFGISRPMPASEMVCWRMKA